MNTTAASRDTALAPWQGWAGLWNGDLPQAEHVSQQGPSRRTAHRAGTAAGTAAAPRTRYRQPRSSAADNIGAMMSRWHGKTSV